jgi:predicted transcriptional regulator
MATLQQQIAEKFLAKLAEAKEVDAAKIEQLRALLAEGKKPKADDFVRIFSLPAGGDLA